MRWLNTFCFGLPIGIAFYAISSHLLLQIDATLPLVLFPLCLLIGGIAGHRCTPRPPARLDPGPASLPRWLELALPWSAGSLLLLALGLMIYGSLSSIPRDWDGFVAWSLRARYLVPPTTLSQPYFTDPAIYCFGLTYPPLQPLCLGSMQGLLGELPGQLLFPLLYLACITTVFLTLEQHGLRRSEVWLGSLAFGLTPMWLNRGAGAVDSGYADLFLGYAAILSAAGLLRRDSRLLFLGALLLPLIKPEGTAYALALCLITAFTGPPRHHLAATWGLTLALLLWLPLRTGASGAMNHLGPLLLLVALLALRHLAQRCSTRTMIGVGCGLAVLAAVSLFLAQDALRSSSNLLLRDFAPNLLELGERLTRTPELLRGYADGAVALKKYGLLFVLALGLLVLPRRLAGPVPCRPLAALFVAGLGLACLAMLLSPDTDLEHVFKSRFDRLLLHWVGPGWLLTMAWVFGRVSSSGNGTDTVGLSGPAA